MNKRIEPSLKEPPADECIPLAQQYESAAERYSFRERSKAVGGQPSEPPPVEEPAPVPVEELARYGAIWPQLKNVLLPEGESADDR